MIQEAGLGSVESDVTRRDFLKVAGLAAASFVLGSAKSYAAFPNSLTLSSEDMFRSSDPQLQMLAQIEQQGEVQINSMMMFIGFPETTEQAKTLAAEMATKLHEWSKYKIRPLVIMEPTFSGGSTLMDLDSFHNSKSHKATVTYFAELKTLGITDEQMGMWVPFPEPNLPEWSQNNTNPQVFAQNVTDVARAIKSSFPRAGISIMLNNQTTRDANWSDSTMSEQAAQQYISAFKNIVGYKNGLLSSFGYQGFPWNVTDVPSKYLDANTVISLAKDLGVRGVWLNTGTFSEVIDPNLSPPSLVTATSEQRAQQLAGILAQAQLIKHAGYKVAVDIFAQNKYQTSPPAGANYSYSDNPTVLAEFIDNADKSGIGISLFLAPAV